MSFWSRVVNVFRGEALGRQIHEEFEAHIADAIADGRDPAEARRAFGRAWSRLDESRDFRLIPWLDSVRGDMVFAWRQLNKNRVTTVAAVLSIGLATGACTAAFRLADALLLRPLPVDHPERLFVLSEDWARSFDGLRVTIDSCDYPAFRRMRALVRDQAELVAISYAERTDLTYAGSEAMEKANEQYVSGWMFAAFGLRPALGRVFTEDDDRTPGAHPYAVLSYDYWKNRFGGDERVIGRSFRIGNQIYEIIGVAQKPFTGTETGTAVDIFIPTMMVKNHGIERSDYQWFRTFVKLKPGVASGAVRDRLDAALRLGTGTPTRGEFALRGISLNTAAAGVSRMQTEYGRPLAALSALVCLVLIIACVNVANLMAVNAAARSREMALRISIGAGRWRLAQLVLIESALLSCAAALTGCVFAWWSAPFVVHMISSRVAPTQLALPADWRVLGFCAAIAFGVAGLLSVPAALRVSAVQPANEMKGGGRGQSRGRVMHVLIAVQAGFCFLVLFAGCLFAGTFARLSRQPTGFPAERILTLETLTAAPVKAVFWEQVADRLRAVPGVEGVALSEWPLLTGESWSNLIATEGGPPKQVQCYLLATSPGWRAVMGIPLLAGRDFRAGDKQPGSAIVNNAFVKEYFGGADPIGKSFELVFFGGERAPYRVVGRAGDARYRDLREPMAPVAYLPFTADYMRGTFIVRTTGRDPLPLAPILRRTISQARPDFYVSNIRTQTELIESHAVRERLLATLALFFGAVALLLAGVGLYSLLDYTVFQRRREIGIRMALGANANGIAARLTGQALGLVLAGVAAGLGVGMIAVRYVESLLYGVRAGDAAMLALPGLIVLLAAFVAAAPAAIRAARIDPAVTLRAE